MLYSKESFKKVGLKNSRFEIFETINDQAKIR